MSEHRPSPTRRMWSCGEASWFEDVAGVTTAAELKDLLGYPLRFTARETLRLHRAGVTAAHATELEQLDRLTTEDVIASLD